MIAAAASWILVTTVWAQDDRAEAFANYSTPTKQLNAKDYPAFTDDMELEGFEVAAKRQLDRFKKSGLSGNIKLGGKNYPLSKARESLEVFLDLIDVFKNCRKAQPASVCFAAFNHEVSTRYNVFAPDLKPGDPRYGEQNTSFFTGYATQPIHGKTKPDAVNKYAVYAMPKTKADKAATRGEIDFHGALKNRKLELVYASNIFDLYLLHIEGGGYVTINEGGVETNFYLSFDGTNSQHFEWISKYMMDKGYIDNPSAGAQRKYLRQHPEKHEEILSVCKSYVFFKVSNIPPLGSALVPVTPGRSIATDDKLYPFKGLVAFIQSQKPKDLKNCDLEIEDHSKIQFEPFSRFFIDQDTGGAIVGKGRADLYFGIDDYAQYSATYQAEQGNIYFLLLK